MRILVLTKRQYMNKDLIDDRFGRFREIPLALSQMGHQVTGLCLSYAHRNEGSIKDGLVLWKSMNASALKIPGLMRFMLEALRLAFKSDVIWACSDSVYGAIGCLLGRISKKPVVFDIYDNFGEFYTVRLPLMRQLYLWAIRRSDAVTCLSKPFEQYIRHELGRTEKVYTLEFAVRADLFKPADMLDCRQRLNLPLHVPIIGTAGGLYKIREAHLLVEAFMTLKDKYSDLQLALAGPRDADFMIPNEPRIRDLGILQFEKVPYFWGSLDVAVICYAADKFGEYCFPQKTREIMACNIPLVAARVGSLKELLQDHPDWLYAPGDLGSLVKAIERRLTDSSTGYPPAPTWVDLAERLEDIMLKLCKGKPIQQP
jgi:glycosyltransferase involved in cell wall biosynthesis